MPAPEAASGVSTLLFWVFVIEVVVRMTALTPYVSKSTLEANPGMPCGYFQVRVL